MLWSSGLLGGAGGRISVCLLPCVGVVLRLAAHGFIDSTAEVKYDFSTFLSEAPEAMVMENARHALRETLRAYVGSFPEVDETRSRERV